MPKLRLYLFDSLPRAPRRKLAHVIDVGPGGELDTRVRFGCSRCTWESEWTTEYGLTESKRGIPCPCCTQ